MLLVPTTKALASMSRHQLRREPWPDFEAFDPDAYPIELRRKAAWQWWGRAQAEHGSVHQFSAVTRALCELRAPYELLGALSRLITDEVRHVELCARAAKSIYPEGESEKDFYDLRSPFAPWPDAPLLHGEPTGAKEMKLRGWACRAILTACAIGETLSRPMLDALATVSTDPMPRLVCEQILKDEQLHGRFGFEALAVLVPELNEEEKQSLHTQLRRSLAGFERTTCGPVRLEDLAGTELTIEAPSGGDANLGTLSYEQFAMIFYATLEQEIFPGLQELGLDPMQAWKTRGKAKKTKREASPEAGGIR